MRNEPRYLAVWAAPMGAVVGVLAAVVGNVGALPSEAAGVGAGLLVAIVFSTGAWGSGLFIPGIGSGEAEPNGPERFASRYLTLPLMLLWATQPVIALAGAGCENEILIAVIFAGLGSASAYALTAGMYEGLRRRE